jgi:hypothetical protein
MKPLTRCNSRINLGTYSSAGTDLYVYFENLATGERKQYSATSDAGDSEILLTHSDSFTPHTSYKVWLNEESTTMSDEVEWTLPDGTTDVTCLIQRFEDVFDASGARVEETSVTVKAA